MKFYLTDDEPLDAKKLPAGSDQLYCIVHLADAEQIPTDAEVLVCLADDALRKVLTLAHQRQWVLSLLKHAQSKHSVRGFQLSNQMACLNDDDSNIVAMDILRSNGELVLNKLVVGRAFAFQPGGHSANPWHRLKTAWHQLRHLKEYRAQAFKIKTASASKELDAAAVGIVATTHAQGSNLAKQLLADAEVNDSMFYSVLVAPRSVLQMLKHLVAEPFVRNVRQPGFIAVLRSSAVTIKSSQEFEYRIDEQTAKTQELVLECLPGYIKLRVAKGSVITQGQARQKEIRRVQALGASTESIQSIIGKPLPWITHAATEDFKELYQQLRENAQLTSSFSVFMVLATLLAGFGLYANSAPVIIGAMILAPLMAPIISLAMAFARQDASLLIRSAKTLLAGFALAMLCATLLSWCLPLQIETAEITARLRPTLLDLGIAIVSGIAGAYAHARSEAAKSLAGVAIAVALVPPIAVAGIGIGWLSWHVAGGALLLFLTNLAGIVFAASATFMLLGFTAFARARRGLIAAAIAVVLVSLPLALSFQQLMREAAIVTAIEQVALPDAEIRSIKVLSIKPTVLLSLDIVSLHSADAQLISVLKQSIEQALKVPVVLEVSWVNRY